MFKRKKSDKLSDKEIQDALVRIRKTYDDYIISYMTPIDEKTGFEDRYITALHARVNLTRFIKDEIEHLQALIKGRKDEASRKKVSAAKPASTNKKGFADQIMEELERKIESYPEIEINDDASVEVKKLYGALNELDKNHWRTLSKFIRKVHSSTVSYNLENRLLRMTTVGGDHVPPELDRYLFLLQQKGKYSSELFREAQECIKRASFFLHELRHILLECQDRGLMDESVEIAFNYVENIISDFRLKDLKRF
ncbi:MULTISPECIES: hypothetical protein [unclassified Oceanispirochaeta]|uniref:hypothetical protein n=1 Tax=unclassified Oceanispirochaeta TaxID=2635722 RepID=UPI000E08E6A7|nr:MULTISPECIES: hypothetical protein [unclassified Oceanispirochaeta]MBF9014599.1 hypothetical protein [Oceanispirochaeta sp. M2]NPD70855.1 hypothetical protein [Oceanispirochaeta sp. M1]RDG34135.1 hypothetical protein DV872_01975 [Oceanispirochaeta sp. M1]